MSVPGYPFTEAAPDETIAIYGVGFGAVSPPVISGSAVQTGTLSVLPACSVGGQPSTVVFAGLAGPGLYQINLMIPPKSASGDAAVNCKIDRFGT